MKHRFFVLGALALFAGIVPARADDPLERAFANPPAAARPHTWWHWINGNVSQAGITADLEAMARAGIGGAQIFNVDVGIPAGKTPYFSPQWRAAVVHAAREADRLGIELCFHNCAGWSSSGGPWITPDRSMQMLTWSETSVAGGSRFSGKLAAPEMRMGFYRDICVLAVPKPAGNEARIADVRAKAFFERGASGLPTPNSLTASETGTTPRNNVVVLSCAPDGTLNWDAPAGSGEWTLLRMGHTSTGKDNHPAPEAGRGLECDKLSREAMNFHWANGIAPILKDLGPLAGKSLNNSLIDSYEVGSQNWTPKFREEFQKRRGYDPLPFLPVVTGRVIGSREVSERFLWDWRRTIADLFAENYVGRFRELCHQNGLQFSLEPYGNGPSDNLQIGTMADIPMGEFWVGGAASETIKIAASAAHVAGRSLVGAESFTADEQHGRWLVEPYGVKALGDRMFTLGVNRYIFHRYAHQPWQNLAPGMTMGPWGMHLERTQTWWDTGTPAWLRYVARCQSLLQSGRFVADVLSFCGDDAPNDVPTRGTLPSGYDYDGCDRTTLMRLTVKNGQLVLPGGMAYHVLVLPDSPWMTPATLRKVADLVKAGATVVGSKPLRSPSLTNYPACDDEVSRLADAVWGNDAKLTEHRFGAGRVVWGKPVAALLPVPDMAQATGQPALPWIHRQANGTDLYFVSNPRYRNLTADVTFRVSGKAPELWHPETGTVEPAPVWRAAGSGQTRVTLRLGPAESVFVVFRRPIPRGGGEHFVRVVRESGPETSEPAPVLTIQEAVYEAVDGAGRADVTDKVRAMLAAGETEIPASNAAFGDPTPLHVKRLRIRYILNGKQGEKTADENQTIDLAGAGADTRLPDFDVTANHLLAYAPGTYKATTASGKTLRFTALAPRTLPLSGPWHLSFPPNLGAPSSVSLNKLTSWTEQDDPGVRYFSGSAIYGTTFNILPQMRATGRALILDLGRVKNFALVRVNGKTLPVLWKAPFRVNVSGLVKPGVNTLSIRVTNLWPNRLIGDEQQPDEVNWNPDGSIQAWPQWLANDEPRPKSNRVAFTTWRFWHKNDSLLESGLLGPVALRAVPILPLK